MRQFLYFGCAALVCFALEVKAQKASDIRQIENYLNNLKSLNANFVQMASNGTTSEGRLFIQKPNKIRMEYAAPVSVLIVGNGDYIVFNDKELDQVTNIDYEDIPATMILKDNIKIDGQNLKVTDFVKDAGTTSVTLEYTQDSDMGPITLVFNNNPFELKQWKVVDPQSVEIALSLYDIEQNQKLDENLFTFKKATSKSQAGGRRRR